MSYRQKCFLVYTMYLLYNLFISISLYGFENDFSTLWNVISLALMLIIFSRVIISIVYETSNTLDANLYYANLLLSTLSLLLGLV